MPSLPHARDRLAGWISAWNDTGRLVMLLDFDGTLAPIVDDASRAAMPARTRAALDRLREAPGVQMAIISGRSLASVRDRAGLPGIAYAGNHGMEIEAPGLRQVYAPAETSRPLLEALAARLAPDLEEIGGAWIEDKQLTLSVHTRQVARAELDVVRARVFRAAAAQPGLHVTEGKEVIEVRPTMNWDKGKAVEFLLERFGPPVGAPVLYLGDDRTDEDAFRVLGGIGDGVVVGDPPPPESAATAFLRDPDEVGEFLDRMAAAVPLKGPRQADAS